MRVSLSKQEKTNVQLQRIYRHSKPQSRYSKSSSIYDESYVNTPDTFPSPQKSFYLPKSINYS